ncbi:MAG: TIGR01777 family oxidoreductase [Intrasporangium sp.]|uniref:TIGR01777 family oxidoreductase n=1 Tax=Intrasporangium sp. TaxID=1925024 RepID=UPI0026474CCD|nr:TIGR01777 family oxidoreductase [Intrasporangium sp.]MDN5797777.1 TIGR01777 family oxidoreductase [Intrasporangium sp.]
MSKRVAVAGSSGLIGGALCRHLLGRGDQIVRLVRRPAAAPDEVRWSPSSGYLPPDALAGVDALVNLAGIGINARRWTGAHKAAIERSRVDATGAVAQTLARLQERMQRPVRLVNASAVGFYGDRGDEVLTEASHGGADFLSGVVARWEDATRPATAAGVPVAVIRSGLVMTPDGGAFRPLLRLTRLGLAGPLGSGRQWWPWITLVDEVRAITHLLDHPELTGPVNAAAPEPHRQQEIAQALAGALHRIALVPAPRPALRLVIGEFADRILDSQLVEPQQLLASGFTFEHPDLASAVTWLADR